MGTQVRKNRLFIIFAIIVPLLGYASPTGKISGIVTDARTNEALIGVNVVIKDLSIGAATDVDGQFVILNVPPGEHQLDISYIGYKTLKVDNVYVRIDRTTTVNAKLQEALMEGETVVIQAERPIVERDKTSSSVHFDAEELKVMPVEGVRNILELSAAINRNADGTISIRGGDALDVNFMVDGIKSLNTNTGIPAYGTGAKSDNNWKYDINPLAVAQMEVISGGFNAEYGNAQSGLVKMITREGGEKFSGGLIIEYRAPGQYHWGDYLYSKNQPEWQLWGNIDAWYNAYRDSTGQLSDEKKLLADINYNLWVKNHTPSDDNILGVYDYRSDPYVRYLFSFGGPLGSDAKKMNFFFSGEIKQKPTRLPTSEKTQKLSNYSLKLTYKPSTKHQFHMTNLYQSNLSGMGSGSDDIRWAGLSGSYGARRKYTLVYDSPREETVFAQTLEYKYIYSPRAFLETSLTHQSEVLYAMQDPTPATDRDRQLHPEPEDRLLEDTGIWLKKPLNEYRAYYTWSSIYNQASETDYYEVKSNYSAQLTNTNLLKAGIEAWYMDQNYNASSSLCVSAFIWRTGFATNYKAKTWYTAAYLQDKMEFAGVVGNIGLRFDMYNFGVDVPSDPYNFLYPADGLYPNVGVPGWEDSKTYASVSPRAGLSFPIAEKTAFRIQYGHFRSMPSMNQALDNQTYNGWASYGNPNMKPKLSINYEIGVQQNLWDTHQLDVVTYYNDLKDQISPIDIRSQTGSWKRDSTYQTYSNNGHGNSRGIEVTLKNRGGGAWRYTFSYALSQTMRGYHGAYLIDPRITTDLERYLYANSEFLSPEDRTHRFNASVSYYIEAGDGPQIAGLKPLDDLTISLIYRLTSGVAYFYSSEYQFTKQVESNRRYPMESNTDLKIDKNISLGRIGIKLGIRVLNALNNKHLTTFSDSEELERWVLRGVSYADRDYDYAGQEIDRPATIYNYFQTYRNIPREIFFSLGITF